MTNLLVSHLFFSPLVPISLLFTLLIFTCFISLYFFTCSLFCSVHRYLLLILILRLLSLFLFTLTSFSLYSMSFCYHLEAVQSFFTFVSGKRGTCVPTFHLSNLQIFHFLQPKLLFFYKKV